MKVTLKNGEVKEFDSPLSVYEIAASLSAGLAKKACAAEIDGTPAYHCIRRLRAYDPDL